MGIILYEMATGQRRFQGDSTALIFSSIIKDTPRSVTEVNPGLPHDLVRIIQRCLNKNPEYRYRLQRRYRPASSLATFQR